MYTTGLPLQWTSIRRGLADPGQSWSTVRGRVRGLLFTYWCRLFRPRIQIGRRLFLDGKLVVRGPGRVIIGDNVTVGMIVTPFTYSPAAVISIGEKTFLNGTRFGCKERIDIEPRCILAECRIMDYDFHSIDPDHRNDPDHIRARPVLIGENVWVTVQCVIQKGVTIGRNSTITPNSVVRGDVPANTLAGGNPAIVWKHLDSSEISQPVTPRI